MVRIKICGITNREDAAGAAALGADALGFIFAQSPRQVDPEEARQIIETLPPLVQTVGVFVDEDLSIIRRVMDLCGLDLVQLHGDESPAFCHRLMPRAVKAFRLKDETSLRPIGEYRGKVRAILLDTFRKGAKGGTGETFDWDLAVQAKKWGMPLILSGGLTSSNVEGAVDRVGPFAVDVNSGVEERPGKKDPLKMKALMDKIRRHVKC
jgi:phosphoribosylanthranilate isomerase